MNSDVVMVIVEDYMSRCSSHMVGHGYSYINPNQSFVVILNGGNRIFKTWMGNWLTEY